VRQRLTDVTTGLYLITAICGLVDAVCFPALGHATVAMFPLLWGDHQST
jgi:hypothetical protein